MGLFDQIFTGQRLSNQLDLKSLEVDLHSHLIPALDDGVGSFEESLELIKRLNELGIKKVITTPHVKQDYYRNTPEIILRGRDSLRHYVDQANIPVEIEAAAEYLIDDGFEEKLTKKELLTFGDKYLLVELSYYEPHPNINSIIFNLQVDGYKVILAHPERYAYWYRDFNKLVKLKERGVFFQINLVSLDPGNSPSTVKITEKLISTGMVDFLGTDIHNKLTLESVERALFTKNLEKLLSSGKLLNPTLL